MHTMRRTQAKSEVPPASGGYITPAAWRVPTASERGAESQVAHKWARWLHNPRRLGGPDRFRGWAAHLWATSDLRRGGATYVAESPQACPLLSPARKGGPSEVAHKWATWLHNPRSEAMGTPPRRQGLCSHPAHL